MCHQTGWKRLNYEEKIFPSFVKSKEQGFSFKRKYMRWLYTKNHRPIYDHFYLNGLTIQGCINTFTNSDASMWWFLFISLWLMFMTRTNITELQIFFNNFVYTHRVSTRFHNHNFNLFHTCDVFLLYCKS